MPGNFDIFPNNSIADYCLITALLLFSGACVASYPEIRFSAESIEHENFVLHQVQAQLNPEGGFELDAARIAVQGMEREIKGISVEGVVQHGQYSVDLKFARKELETLKGLDSLLPELNWVSRGYIDAGLKFQQPPDGPPLITVQLGTMRSKFRNAAGAPGMAASYVAGPFALG